MRLGQRRPQRRPATATVAADKSARSAAARSCRLQTRRWRRPPRRSCASRFFSRPPGRQAAPRARSQRFRRRSGRAVRKVSPPDCGRSSPALRRPKPAGRSAPSMRSRRCRRRRHRRQAPIASKGRRSPSGRERCRAAGNFRGRVPDSRRPSGSCARGRKTASVRRPGRWSPVLPPFASARLKNRRGSAARAVRRRHGRA